MHCHTPTAEYWRALVGRLVAKYLSDGALIYFSRRRAGKAELRLSPFDRLRVAVLCPLAGGRAANQVEAAFLRGLVDDDRVQPRNVARRDNVDQRARHECDLGLAAVDEPGHVMRRLGPPGLGRKEALCEEVKRPLETRPDGRTACRQGRAR